MARRVLRYTLTRHEQSLWDTEEMKGWREAMQAYVEDEARERGCRKYVVYDRRDSIVAKGIVNRLQEPVSS